MVRVMKKWQNAVIKLVIYKLYILVWNKVVHPDSEAFVLFSSVDQLVEYSKVECN